MLLGLGNGVLNKVANFLGLLALTTLPATVQSPFTTGGIIIISTMIAVLMHQKPSRRELLSVGLAFVGMVILVCFPT